MLELIKIGNVFHVCHSQMVHDVLICNPDKTTALYFVGKTYSLMSDYKNSFPSTTSDIIT